MKKIISSVLLCIMLFGMVIPCAFASEESAYGDSIVFYSDNIKTNSGEDFVLDVNAGDNPGIATYMIILEYDNTVLDVTSKRENERLILENSINKGSCMSNEKYAENKVIVLGAGAENFFEDGKLFGFKFTAKEDAPSQKTTIKVILNGIYHVDDNYGTYEVFDLFDGEVVSYDVTVLINSNEELEEKTAKTTLKCLTEKEFYETYDERLEEIEENKPKPKPIDANLYPSPVKKEVKLVLNKDFSAYMAPAAQNAFEPDRNATRYEIVSALNKIFTIQNAQTKDEFSDVSPEYKKMVNDFAQAGVITGYESNIFGGERSITRAEFVKLLATAFKIDLKGESANSFSDTNGHWAEEYINAFVNEGYIVGYEDSTFKPDNCITRAETVTVINRVLKIENGEPFENKFEDLDETHWAYPIIMSIF